MDTAESEGERKREGEALRRDETATLRYRVIGPEPPHRASSMMRAGILIESALQSLSRSRIHMPPDRLAKPASRQQAAALGRLTEGHAYLGDLHAVQKVVRRRIQQR
jgi:hypothetical protein